MLPGRVWPARVVSFSRRHQHREPGGAAGRAGRHAAAEQLDERAAALRGAARVRSAGRLPRGVRLGSQATVMVYTEEAVWLRPLWGLFIRCPGADLLCLLSPGRTRRRCCGWRWSRRWSTALAVWMGAALPFVSGLLFATFALRMPAPPPFASVVLLALLLVVLPLAFASIAGVLEPVSLPDGRLRRPGAVPRLPVAGGAEDGADRRADADLRHHAADRDRPVASRRPAWCRARSR